jgi:aspartyl-tRNA(Asn)/glutamyl-tRNA(Gln) amidotransferase subunit A
MTMLPPDPLEPAGIAGFAERLRSSGITAQAATRAYLERIEVLDPRLGAYQYVAADQALEAAGALEDLLGVPAKPDLGGFAAGS